MTAPSDIAAASPPAAPARTWTKAATRPLRSWRKSLAIWLFARLVRVPVPWAAVRQTDAGALLAHEHRRLLALSAAGERVPPVLAFDGQTLTTGDIGPTLDACLDRLPPADRLDLMAAASADLARFHARGQWHGGAQARNITWDGRQFARLDFEECLHPALPLPTVQAYDALQLLLSLSRWFDELGPDAVHRVLRAYAEAEPPIDLRAFVRPLLSRLDWVRRALGWSRRLHGSREAQRLRSVLDGLRAFAVFPQAAPSRSH